MGRLLAFMGGFLPTILIGTALIRPSTNVPPTGLPITSKGDLVVGTGGGGNTRLGVGSDTQILTADSTQTSGVKWAAAPDASSKVPLSTVTTKGDLIAATGNAAVTRLAAGTDRYELIADSSQSAGLRWGIPVPAPVPISGRRVAWGFGQSNSDTTYSAAFMTLTFFGGGTTVATPLTERMGMVFNVGSTTSTTRTIASGGNLTRLNWLPRLSAVVRAQTTSNISQGYGVDNNSGTCGPFYGATMPTMSTGAASACSTTQWISLIHDSRGNAATHWLCCSGDGSNFSCSDTGTTVSTVADQTLVIEATSSSSITCSVGGNSVVKTSNLPAAASDLRLVFGAQNNSNAANPGPNFGAVAVESAD